MAEAPEPPLRYAPWAAGGTCGAVLVGREAGLAGPHMSAPAGAGPSRVRAGASGARPGGGPYLPTRA